MKRGMTLWRYFTDSQEHAGGFIMVKAVVGANWGDEGKGKITDMLAEKADIIIRFQGGANAGHTIINDYGKFALHTLPSGVFYGHTTSIIGNGVAVDIPVLFKEIQSIIDRDVPMPKILVSDRAQMVMSVSYTHLGLRVCAGGRYAGACKTERGRSFPDPSGQY